MFAMKELPLISCLMITKGINTGFIDDSIYCYTIQTYRNKELVVVTDCDPGVLSDLKRFLKKYRNENIRLVPLKERLSLGELRNVSVDNASGEYCIQWDDDDLYHEERIESQYNGLVNGDYDYCFLNAFMMYFTNTHLLSMNKWPLSGRLQGFPGSILFKRGIDFRYPGLSREEDVEIVNHPELKRCILQNPPYLYVYIYRGINTNTYEHFHSLHHFTRMTFDTDVVEKVSHLFGHAGLDYRF
jgi:glycosyltransferase involved in cell wall biosynthesis